MGFFCHDLNVFWSMLLDDGVCFGYNETASP